MILTCWRWRSSPNALPAPLHLSLLITFVVVSGYPHDSILYCAQVGNPGLTEQVGF